MAAIELNNRRPVTYHVYPTKGRAKDWRWKCVSGNGRCTATDHGFDTVRIAIRRAEAHARRGPENSKWQIKVAGQIIGAGVV